MQTFKASLLFLLWKNGQTNVDDVKDEQIEDLLSLGLVGKSGFSAYYVTNKGREAVASILEKIDAQSPMIALSVSFGSEKSEFEKKVMRW